MDRLNLPLGPGITSVVGPNGCGKSNIVDALRWILGETRAKHLRGTLAEDVIFNGTESLRPLGLAEVTLTLKAARDDFFEDLTSQSLEAKKAVDEALAEVGEEGKDEAQPSPSHLRVVQDFPPEKPLRDETQGAQRGHTLADKFAWLKAASEVQLTRRLYRSGESEYFINRVPCRLKDIKELCRAVGLGARAYTVVAQGEVTRIISAKPEERRLILEEAAGVAGFRDKIAATNRRLKETDTDISRVEDIIKEVSRQVNSLRRQAARARNREQLKAEIAECQKAVFADRYAHLRKEEQRLELWLSECRGKENSAISALQKAQACEQEARAKLMSVDVETDSVRAKIDSIAEEIAGRERTRSSRHSRIIGLQATEEVKRENLNKLRASASSLSEKINECSKTSAGLKDAHQTLIRRIKELEQVQDGNLADISKQLEDAQRRLKDKENEISKFKEKMVADRILLSSLRDQLKSLSLDEQLKGSLGGSFKESAKGVMIDGLKIPAHLVDAVQAVLADRAGYLVLDDPCLAAKAFSKRSAEVPEEERTSLGLFRAGRGDLRADDTESGTDLPSLASLIEVESDWQLAAAGVFDGVYAARDLEEAYSFLDSVADSRVRVVTERGEIVSKNCFSLIRKPGGLVKLRAKAGELEIKCMQHERNFAALQDKKISLEKEIEKFINDRKKELIRCEEKRGEIKRFVREAGELQGRLEAEIRLLDRFECEHTAILSQIEKEEIVLKELCAERARLTEEIARDLPEDDANLKNAIGELKEKESQLIKERDTGRESLAEMADEVNQNRMLLDEARSEVSRCELDLQKIQMELEHLSERIVESLGAEFDSLVRNASEEALKGFVLAEDQRNAFKEKLERLIRRIAREGEVDFESINQFEAESARLDELMQQKTDLEEAAGTLRKTVSKLSEISKSRFVETFHAVSENFNKLMPKLFGGGMGRLELVDPSNPLESGVEIIARPPGKKLKTLELLSGGEKALCAVGLIFSMFIERPSPICVLDEVDAPLDDANVVRFLSLVKEMSSRTQFLLITHNKQSMSIADKLVGVTMQQPGASTVVTVSLKDAYSYAVNG